jgi:hypothetical protein
MSKELEVPQIWWFVTAVAYALPIAGAILYFHQRGLMWSEASVLAVTTTLLGVPTAMILGFLGHRGDDSANLRRLAEFKLNADDAEQVLNNLPKTEQARRPTAKQIRRRSARYLWIGRIGEQR